MFDINDESNDETQSEETGFNFVENVRDRFAGDDGRGNVIEVNEDSRDIQRWGLGNHSSGGGPSEDDFDRLLDGMDEDVDSEMKALLEEAAQMTSQTSVSGFECPVCGLNHGHSDSKHDIRSAFSVSDELTEVAEFCPYCHCGVVELAMLVDYFGVLGEELVFFEDQDDFEGVLELDNKILQKIMRRRRSGDTIPVVIRQAGLEDEVPRDLHRDLALFFERWLSIKNAASNAPIHQETQSDIEEERDEVEELVAELRQR